MNWLSRNKIPLVAVVIILLMISGIASSYPVNLCGIQLLKSNNSTKHIDSICIDQDSFIYRKLLSSVDGRYILSMFSNSQGDWQMAEKLFPTEDIKTNMLLSYWLGYFYHQQGELDKAVEVWKENQPFVEGTWKLAEAQVLIGDFNEAITLYQLASLLQPENPELWLEYGKVLWNVKYVPEEQNFFSDQELTQTIEKAFKNAVSIDPSNYESLDRYAWFIYREENDSNTALKILLSAWNSGGNNDPWVNYHLGRIYEDQIDVYEANLSLIHI